MFRHTSTAHASWRPRPERRRALFWWPAAAIAGLTALLWTAGWPRGPARGAPPARRLPEPNAAYVLVGPGVQSLYLKADIIARPSWIGFGRSLKEGPDDGESPAEHRLPPPAFLPGGEPAPAEPAELRAPARLPGLAERPVEAPRWPAPPAGRALSWTLAPALRGAGFTARVARAQLPPEAGRVRAWVELDEQGRVLHLLGEGEDGAAPPPQALQALRAGGGTNAAAGWIDLFWDAERPAVKPVTGDQGSPTQEQEDR